MEWYLWLSCRWLFFSSPISNLCFISYFIHCIAQFAPLLLGIRHHYDDVKHSFYHFQYCCISVPFTTQARENKSTSISLSLDICQKHNRSRTRILFPWSRQSNYLISKSKHHTHRTRTTMTTQYALATNVSKPENKGKGRTQVTDYLITTTFQKGQSIVRRTYEDFEWLHIQLIKERMGMYVSILCFLKWLFLFIVHVLILLTLICRLLF
jgi:hypothetical protein